MPLSTRLDWRRHKNVKNILKT